MSYTFTVSKEETYNQYLEVVTYYEYKCARCGEVRDLEWVRI